MLIKRTDTTEPVDIEFTGALGEEPAVYRFIRAGTGAFVCEIADPIVIHRLLGIPCYAQADPGEALPDLAKKPARRAEVTPSGGPGVDITAARAHYKQVIGRAPSPRWDAAELLRRIDAHISGAGNDGNDGGDGNGDDDQQPGSDDAPADVTGG